MMYPKSSENRNAALYLQIKTWLIQQAFGL